MDPVIEYRPASALSQRVYIGGELVGSLELETRRRPFSRQRKTGYRADAELHLWMMRRSGDLRFGDLRQCKRQIEKAARMDRADWVSVTHPEQARVCRIIEADLEYARARERQIDEFDAGRDGRDGRDG